MEYAGSSSRKTPARFENLRSNPNEHLYDSNELFLCRNNLFLTCKLSHEQNVQTRRAFKSRAACHFEKSGAIFIREFAVSLGDVQRNTCRRSFELILCSCFCGDCRDKLSDPATESDGFLINIQFFVIKICFHFSIRVDHEHEHEHDKIIYPVSISINSTQRLL